ncbi:MAG: translation elongation factor Ts [Anaerolineae bacterium]
MKVTTEMIKELRARTGAGVLDVKRALEDSGGDIDIATQALREKGLAVVDRVAGREAREGLVEAYIHGRGRLGALVEINCETDFVARTEEFRALAHDVAMQVTATDPRYLSSEDIPLEKLEERRDALRAEVAGENGSQEKIDELIEGGLEEFIREVCLLNQPFIKDEGLTVQDHVNRAMAQFGENLVVRRFARFELGEG